MKNILTSLLFVVAVLLFLGSCYKDEGNYDYTDINNISITSDSNSIRVMLPDTLRVNTVITQTKPGTEGLSFQWVLYPAIGAPTTRRTIGTDQNLKAIITEEPGSYRLDFFVKDKQTGVEFQKTFSISVLTKLSEGWVVVEEKAGGCDLTMITPIDSIYRDVYSPTNGDQLLPLGTSRIPDIKTNRGIQSVYVLSPADGQYVSTENFLKVRPYPELFYQAPNPPKPQEYFMNTDFEVMVDNGKLYNRALNLPAGNNKLTLPPLGPAGDYYMAPFEMYAAAIGYIWYDTIGQRFYRQSTTNFELSAFGSAQPTDLFDMNNIGKRLIYAEVNAVGANNVFYSFFRNNNDDSLFAFSFQTSPPTGQRMPVARYDGLDAPGMHTAKFFVLSRSLPHLYYTSGNVIYRLDIPAKTAAPVYTFPAGTEIRAMKMYRNLKTTDANTNKMIAVATLEGGTQGKVYYFPIAATGNFTNNTYSKVFTGFGKINEITFKSLK
ncbi:MAG TPA: PKD-like family lipoprotein [Chitinophagaceae bacterium]